MKTRPGGDVAVAARLELDRAAPGGDADAIAGGDAEPAQFGGSEAATASGSRFVEHARAPGHRAGVPVLEQPAGGQHHRVFVIGLLGGRHDRGGDQPAAPGGGREPVAEDDVVPGLGLGVAGIGHRALALEPLPGDARSATASPASSRRRRRADACSSSRGRCGAAISWMIHQSCRASPGSGSAARPICTRRSVLVKVPSFSGKAEAGNTTSAYYAVSVRKMSCTTRCSSLASASRACVDVGIRHRRVLAHDVHAVDLAGMDRVHDLDDGQAGLGVEPVCHNASKLLRERLASSTDW